MGSRQHGDARSGMGERGVLRNETILGYGRMLKAEVRVPLLLFECRGFVADGSKVLSLLRLYRIFLLCGGLLEILDMSLFARTKWTDLER